METGAKAGERKETLISRIADVVRVEENDGMMFHIIGIRVGGILVPMNIVNEIRSCFCLPRKYKSRNKFVHPLKREKRFYPLFILRVIERIPPGALY